MSTPAKSDPTHPDLGKMFGSYEVKAVLGEGGMGEVFLAQHERLNRRVALKQLKPALAKNRKAVKRFVDEAWAIGQIQHANIVKVTDFVLGENDVYYIMELLEGCTLSEELARSGVLDPARAAHIASEVASALHAVHAKGFVHGDIKPSNIFLVQTPGEDDKIKLLDFGIAKLMGDEVDDTTAAHLVTPVYMSPEQADRQTTAGAADLYSLGAVLYHMLVGSPPFEAATFAEYVYKHTQEPPAPLRRRAGPGQRLSAELESIVMRCLEKKPAQRFSSARELRHALRTAPLQGAPQSRVRELVLGNDRTGWLTRLCLVAGGVALLVALINWTTDRPRRPPKPAWLASTSAPPIPGPDASTARRATPVPRVVLRVQSEPSRATVHRTRPDPRILGLTPLRLDLPLTEKIWQVEVRLEGYQTQTLKVSLTADTLRRVVLKPTAPIPDMAGPMVVAPRRLWRPPPRRPPRPVDPMGIIDPFGDSMGPKSGSMQ